MPIVTDCPCGKQLRVPDEAAGRRVKCPACGDAVTVPGKKAPAPADMIRFRCECGKEMQARAEHAGRSARCPECGEKVAIPGGEEAPARRARVQAEKPAPKRTRPVPDDEEDLDRPRRRGRARDEDDEDPDEPRARRRARDDDEEEDFDEPRRRPSRRKRRAVWPWVAAGVALFLLIGGGVGAWMMLGGGRPDDLALVPGNAQGFVTFRVADLWKTDAAQKLMQKAKQQGGGKDVLGEMEKETGLTPADIDRVTVVFIDAQSKNVYAVIKTNKAVDRSKFKKDAQEKQHAGKTYLAQTKNGETLAAYFLSDKVMVFGTEEGIKSCLSVMGKRPSGPLDDPLKTAAGSHHVVGAFAPTPAMLQQAKMATSMMGGGMPGVPKNSADMLEIKTATLIVDVGSTLDVTVQLAYADGAKATATKKALDEGITQGKAMLGQMPKGPGGQAQIMNEVTNVLNSLKVEQSGSVVSISLKANLSALMDAAGSMPFGMGAMGGMGGPGRRPVVPPGGQQPPGFPNQPGVNPPGGNPGIRPPVQPGGRPPRRGGGRR